ncbi:MAG: hypothetical protein AAFW00_14195 [Bacteroidota bacterium]
MKRISHMILLLIAIGLGIRGMAQTKPYAIYQDVYVWSFYEYGIKSIKRQSTFRAKNVRESFERAFVEQSTYVPKSRILDRAKYDQVENLINQELRIQEKMKLKNVITDFRQSTEVEQDNSARKFFRMAERVVLGKLETLDSKQGERMEYRLTVEFIHLASMEMEEFHFTYLTGSMIEDPKLLDSEMKSFVGEILARQKSKYAEDPTFKITGKIPNAYSQKVDLYINGKKYEINDKWGHFYFKLKSVEYQDKIKLNFRSERENGFSGDTTIIVERYISELGDIPMNLTLPIRFRGKAYEKTLLGRKRSMDYTGFLITNNNDTLRAERFQPTEEGFAFDVPSETLANYRTVQLYLIHRESDKFEEVISKELLCDSIIQNRLARGGTQTFRNDFFFILRRIDLPRKLVHAGVTTSWIHQSSLTDAIFIPGFNIGYAIRPKGSKSLFLGAELGYKSFRQDLNYLVWNEPKELPFESRDWYLNIVVHYVWISRLKYFTAFKFRALNQFYTKQNIPGLIDDRAFTLFSSYKPQGELSIIFSQKVGNLEPGIAVMGELGYQVQTTHLPQIDFNEFGNANVSMQNQALSGFFVSLGTSFLLY